MYESFGSEGDLGQNVNSSSSGCCPGLPRQPIFDSLSLLAKLWLFTLTVYLLNEKHEAVEDVIGDVPDSCTFVIGFGMCFIVPLVECLSKLLYLTGTSWEIEEVVQLASDQERTSMRDRHVGGRLSEHQENKVVEEASVLRSLYYSNMHKMAKGYLQQTGLECIEMVLLFGPFVGVTTALTYETPLGLEDTLPDDSLIPVCGLVASYLVMMLKHKVKELGDCRADASTNVGQDILDEAVKMAVIFLPFLAVSFVMALLGFDDLSTAIVPPVIASTCQFFFTVWSENRSHEDPPSRLRRTTSWEALISPEGIERNRLPNNQNEHLLRDDSKERELLWGSSFDDVILGGRNSSDEWVDGSQFEAGSYRPPEEVNEGHMIEEGANEGHTEEEANESHKTEKLGCICS